MNITHFGWPLILLLLVVPVALIGTLKLLMRKRGGFDANWGGAVLVVLCWLVAIGAVLLQVRR
ncbi:MAG: glycosyl transferase [Pseudoxanthomonas sp.]